MNKINKPYVCPAELAGTLDNFFRRIIHKPRKILEPYISGGMTVLDLGCGPGYFTVHEVPDKQKMFEELKSLLNPGGRILIVEPKIHVTGKSFNKMIDILEVAGLQIIERPEVSISRAVLVQIRNS
jgi:ubiquinone/menaquinone biosynthesis C-methylase UbiE